jgi:hypothetical protein
MRNVSSVSVKKKITASSENSFFSALPVNYFFHGSKFILSIGHLGDSAAKRPKLKPQNSKKGTLKFFFYRFANK